jgi:hypothetical protein
MGEKQVKTPEKKLYHSALTIILDRIIVENGSVFAKSRDFLRYLWLFLPIFCVLHSVDASEFSHLGPIYDHSKLTLSEGERTEAVGPFYSEQHTGSSSLFAFPPIFSLYEDPAIPQTEWEAGYPILTYDRFGKEYRFQFFQVISWSGGQSIKSGGEKKRITLFPFYFQQRGPLPEDNYTALMPVYGHLKNRLFRDEIFFVLLPGYLQTVKKGIVTDNYLFPFFHLRHGPGLKGWQFWPVVGKEHKEVTSATNIWGDVETVGGHDKFFTLWPFFFKNTLGIGTTNVQKQLVVLPFYTSQVSTSRVSKSYGFPLGYTHTIDREKQYEEKDAPWPFIEFAHGPGKQTKRVWPFYSKARTETLENNFYLWPVYKYNAVHAAPLERERWRILLFLYSDTSEQNTTNHTVFRRRDLWPLYTWRKERNGNTRFQALALLEPLLPGNKSVERVYSPVYALWRQENNPGAGVSSKSLLWNLYREETGFHYRRDTAFFGLFQREKSAARCRWRIFFIPFTTGEKGESR